jgi:hypothetical protein
MPVFSDNIPLDASWIGALSLRFRCERQYPGQGKDALNVRGALRYHHCAVTEQPLGPVDANYVSRGSGHMGDISWRLFCELLIWIWLDGRQQSDVGNLLEANALWIVRS